MKYGSDAVDVATQKIRDRLVDLLPDENDIDEVMGLVDDLRYEARQDGWSDGELHGYDMGRDSQ